MITYKILLVDFENEETSYRIVTASGINPHDAASALPCKEYNARCAMTDNEGHLCYAVYTSTKEDITKYMRLLGA